MCQFCGFRFDAPPASQWPRNILALGVVLALFSVVSLAFFVGSAITIAAGATSLVMQRRVRRARRFTATGQHRALIAPLPAFTTLRGDGA